MFSDYLISQNLIVAEVLLPPPKKKKKTPRKNFKCLKNRTKFVKQHAEAYPGLLQTFNIFARVLESLLELVITSDENSSLNMEIS